jgi:hypothetical protein
MGADIMMGILEWLANGGAWVIMIALIAVVLVIVNNWLLERSRTVEVRVRIEGKLVVYNAETGQPIRVERKDKMGE